MIDGYPRILTIVAAVGAGVSGGVFFAFSTFVMKALSRLPAAQGISAMNAINKAAPAPLFMLALFRTGAVSIALSVAALRHLDQRWAVYVRQSHRGSWFWGPTTARRAIRRMPPRMAGAATPAGAAAPAGVATPTGTT